MGYSHRVAKRLDNEHTWAQRCLGTPSLIRAREGLQLLSSSVERTLGQPRRRTGNQQVKVSR